MDGQFLHIVTQPNVYKICIWRMIYLGHALRCSSTVTEEHLKLGYPNLLQPFLFFTFNRTNRF